jgi:hypothetical protein
VRQSRGPYPAPLSRYERCDLQELIDAGLFGRTLATFGGRPRISIHAAVGSVEPQSPGTRAVARAGCPLDGSGFLRLARLPHSHLHTGPPMTLNTANPLPRNAEPKHALPLFERVCRRLGHQMQPCDALRRMLSTHAFSRSPSEPPTPNRNPGHGRGHFPTAREALGPKPQEGRHRAPVGERFAAAPGRRAQRPTGTRGQNRPPAFLPGVCGPGLGVQDQYRKLRWMRNRAAKTFWFSML